VQDRKEKGHENGWAAAWIR